MVTVSIAVCYVSQGNSFCLVRMEVTKKLLELCGMGVETMNNKELVLIFPSHLSAAAAEVGGGPSNPTQDPDAGSSGG